MNTYHSNPAEHGSALLETAQLRPDAPWTCDDTALKLESYRQGLMAEADVQHMLDHVLACEHCLEQHWWPLQRFLELELTLAALADERPDPFGAWGKDPDASWGELGDFSVPSPVGMGEGVSAQASALDVSRDVGRVVQGVSGLTLIGTVLPPLPQPDVLSAYSVFLNQGVPELNLTPAAQVELKVSEAQGAPSVQLQALKGGVLLDGMPLTVGVWMPLTETHVLVLPQTTYFFEWLAQSLKPDQVAAFGVAILRHAGAFTPLREGESTVGRGATSVVRLPNRDTQENLVWKPGALQAVADPQRRERKARFVLDAFEASSEHAVIKRDKGQLWIKPVKARSIPVRYRGALTQVESGSPWKTLPAGSEVRLGWQLFEVT